MRQIGKLVNVLMFHDVVSHKFPNSGFDRPGALQYTIDENKFKSLMAFCKEYFKDIVFSFDDGGSSFYNIAAPILEEYNKRGLFFISTKYIGTKGFLSEAQIKELHERGHIIASHSHSHPRDISKLTFDEIVNEWATSKAILENIIGEDVKVASIPGGAVSSAVLKGLKQTGYEEVYTSEPTNKTTSYKGMALIGRYTITNHSDINYIDNIFSNSVYRHRLILKYRCLRFLKSILGSNYNKLKQIILAKRK
jgi:peptidoglycan/xylan/chitin deacetylase (PgdA/CDA1 family)